MIYWACKRCAEGLEAPECIAGDTLRCPKCKRLCRVPAAAQRNVPEESLAGIGAQAGGAVNGSLVSAMHDSLSEPPVASVEDIPTREIESTRTPAEFATSRISDKAFDEVAPELLSEASIDDGVPSIEVAIDIAPISAPQAEAVVEFSPIAEIESISEATANGITHDASMTEMVADAVDAELHAHVEKNGTHPATATESAAEAAEASRVTTEELDPAQALERLLESLTPLIQRQLGPAVAQYSSREQAKAAMFARAVVDVYPIRLAVKTHEPGRIVLTVRYRRMVRRTMIGTMSIPDMTVEVAFTNSSGSWSLDRWQKIVAV